MGNTATTPNTLTAQYHYSDPDSDAEGISEYQWYSFNDDTSATGGTATGVTSLDYPTTGADANKYLRFQVTPVDNKGNHGDPVLSGPSFKIGGGT
jgi:hypothetical protein